VTPDQFLLIADPLPEPTLLLSGDGLILAGNRATEDRLGVRLTGLRGRRLGEVVADPPGEVSHYLRACSRNRKMVLGALTLLGEGGANIACRTEGALVRPKGKGVESLLMLRLIPKESAIGQFVALNQRIDDLGREVQRRKQAEEAARQHGERLRVTLGSIGDAVIVTDAEGRVTFQNAVAEGLTGWKEDALGRELGEVFRIVNEQTGEAVESPVSKVLREGVIVGLANHTVLIAKDGTRRPIDDSGAPIRGGDGGIVGVVLVFRDVSERRRVEAGLEAARERVQRVADAVPALISYIDADARYRLNNRAYEMWFGHPREEVFGSHMRDVLGDRAWQAIRPHVEAALAGKVVSYEAEVPYREGGTRWISATYTPDVGDGGVVRGFVAHVNDITQRKALEDQLRDRAERLAEADRRKDEFLALLSHEIRNPLAPIRNALQIIKLSDDRESREIARTMMERQLEQMVRLIDDLMDVSRITRGKMELKKERVELATVVQNAVETSRPLIEQMGHDLTVTLAKHPITVDADPTRLAQVFLNLLNNSAKYTERGGRIWLTAEREASDVVVSVKDNGIGIAADKRTSIFEMFSQVDRSLEKAQGGLGIGLTLVKRLVEMHGGRIEAKSEGPGRGSEFVVRLPVVVEASVPKGDGADAALPKSAFRILIVDDNRDGADSLAMMLKIMGNDTRTAYDGQEGVERAEQYRPDVALFDIGLPKLNGHEACRRIRQQPWGKSVVLIAVTGWGQEEDVRRSHEAGFDHHMVKPVDPNALMKLLAGLKAEAQ
jgi:PAS domain S-box-containing protein